MLAALDGGVELVLAHEMPGIDEGRAAVKFASFFASTPAFLLAKDMYATNVAVPLKGGALRDVSLALLSSELAKKLLMLGAEELEAPSVRWRRGGVRRFCSRSITRQRLDSGGAALCALRGVLPSGDEASQGGTPDTVAHSALQPLSALRTLTRQLSSGSRAGSSRRYETFDSPGSPVQSQDWTATGVDGEPYDERRL